MSEGIPQAALKAITEGDLPALKNWLETGGNLFVRETNKETLLHKAAYNGKPEIIKFLVAQGLPVDVRDQGGYSVLHEAARGAQTEAVRVLLDLGADPEAKLNDGSTIDKMAEDKGAKDILDLLSRARNKPRWLLTGPQEVSFVDYKHDIGYRLTEIFNFKARSYVLITSNLKSNAESAVHKTFSDFGDMQPLLEAQAEFTRLGGALPDAYEKLDKPKKTGLSSRSLSVG